MVGMVDPLRMIGFSELVWLGPSITTCRGSWKGHWNEVGMDVGWLVGTAAFEISWLEFGGGPFEAWKGWS